MISKITIVNRDEIEQPLQDIGVGVFIPENESMELYPTYPLRSIFQSNALLKLIKENKVYAELVFKNSRIDVISDEDIFMRELLKVVLSTDFVSIQAFT